MTSDTYKDPPTDWKEAARHKGTGRIAFQRTVDFTNTGNNEGTFVEEIQVKEADGTLLIETSIFVEWEYFASVSVTFSQDGQSITVSAPNETETLSLN